VILPGVEHWKEQIGGNLVVPIKLRIPEIIARQLDSGGEAPVVERETAQIALAPQMIGVKYSTEGAGSKTS